MSRLDTRAPRTRIQGVTDISKGPQIWPVSKLLIAGSTYFKEKENAALGGWVTSDPYTCDA